MRDAFHHVAIAGDEVHVVIDDHVSAAIERCAEVSFADCHSDRIADSLPERAGRRLDTRRVAVLGMPGRLALPLAELLQVIEREVVAGEIEHAVQQHRRVAGRQHEPVAVHPGRILRVVSQVPSEEHVGERRERHRRARMAGVGFLNGIHREDSDRVDAELVERGIGRG